MPLIIIPLQYISHTMQVIMLISIAFTSPLPESQVKFKLVIRCCRIPAHVVDPIVWNVARVVIDRAIAVVQKKRTLKSTFNNQITFISSQN